MGGMGTGFGSSLGGGFGTGKVILSLRRCKMKLSSSLKGGLVTIERISGLGREDWRKSMGLSSWISDV